MEPEGSLPCSQEDTLDRILSQNITTHIYIHAYAHTFLYRTFEDNIKTDLECGVRMWIVFFWLKQSPMTGFCEQDNETLHVLKSITIMNSEAREI
jgi:hypothetical protein